MILRVKNMDGLERSRFKMRHLLPGSLGQAKSGRAFKDEADATVVRLIDSPRRLPETSIEQRLAFALKETGPISVASLVKRVASELYSDELRKGAGVLDIGLIGERLFNRDIIRELKTGNGILWEMKQQRESL
jgi:hypothetical protein